MERVTACWSLQAVACRVTHPLPRYHINFHQLTQVVLTVLNFVRQPQSFASLTAGLECLHLPADAGSVTLSHKKTPWYRSGGIFITNINKGADVFGRSGNDLLSRALRRSTISAKGFNGRVRNGIGWDTFAIITRSSKHILWIRVISFRNNFH